MTLTLISLTLLSLAFAATHRPILLNPNNASHQFECVGGDACGHALDSLLCTPPSGENGLWTCIVTAPYVHLSNVSIVCSGAGCRATYALTYHSSAHLIVELLCPLVSVLYETLCIPFEVIFARSLRRLDWQCDAWRQSGPNGLVTVMEPQVHEKSRGSVASVAYYVFPGVFMSLVLTVVVMVLHAVLTDATIQGVNLKLALPAWTTLRESSVASEPGKEARLLLCQLITRCAKDCKYFAPVRVSIHGIMDSSDATRQHYRLKLRFPRDVPVCGNLVGDLTQIHPSLQWLCVHEWHGLVLTLAFDAPLPPKRVKRTKAAVKEE